MADDDQDLDNEDLDPQDQGVQQDSSVIRDLRKQLRAAKKDLETKATVEQELGQLRREQQMLKAVSGLGLQAEKQEKFARLADKFIEGDPTEESLRQLAEEYGFVTEQEQAPAAGDVQALRDLASAHVGSRPELKGSPEDYQRQLLEAKTPEEIVRISQEAGILKPIQ